MADKIEGTTSALLKQLRNTSSEGGVQQEGAPALPSPAYCAQIKLFARTQYAFYVGFQILVLALAVAVAVALILFIIRLTDEVDVVGVVGTLGALATGAAAGFLQTQASAAKGRYDEARTELGSAGCA